MTAPLRPVSPTEDRRGPRGRRAHYRPDRGGGDITESCGRFSKGNERTVMLRSPPCLSCGTSLPFSAFSSTRFRGATKCSMGWLLRGLQFLEAKPHLCRRQGCVRQSARHPPLWGYAVIQLPVTAAGGSSSPVTQHSAGPGPQCPAPFACSRLQPAPLCPASVEMSQHRPSLVPQN